jgi:hypothetical protein
VGRRWFGLSLWWWLIAYARLGAIYLIELDRTASLVLALLLIPPALWFYVTALAKALHWVRNRGLPTTTELGAAPNLRWHSPAVVNNGAAGFEVRVQCTNSGPDAQGVGAIVTSTQSEDDLDYSQYYNERGVIRTGEFMFRMEHRGTPALGHRGISWQLVYFDAHARFGYVTDCWAKVHFDGQNLELGPTLLDLSGPSPRHKKYRRLPKHERSLYELLLKSDKG